MTKLVDIKLKDYLEKLKSNAPAPGGGTASALAGAQGAALIIMVTELTIGREKYSHLEELCKSAKAEAQELYEKMVEVIDTDTEAYNMVSEAYKLPKNTDEEKAFRRKAISLAIRKATLIPLGLMESALAGLRLAIALKDKSNPNTTSDLGVAALNLFAALEGACLNVLINVSSLVDKEEAEKYVAQSRQMIVEGERLLEQAKAQ